jgi:enoyl-[acyl-carrier protein] reductase II
MENRITRLLNVEHPIIQGPMRLITMAELAAAVSNAGGFGLIAASSLPGDQLREQIRAARRLTHKPFGVNISLRRPNAEEAIEIVVEEGLKAITTSAGDPGRFIHRLKNADIKVLHVVPSVKLAMKAAQAGVDAVIAEGVESGGHLSYDEVTTMALIPQVADAVDIPVVAAGGIGDARGYLAALALGAEGVQMGTRFLATRECAVSEGYKKAVVEAADTDTTIIERGVSPMRAMKSEAVSLLLELEKNGASPDEIKKFAEEHAAHPMSDDVSSGIVSAGQVAGMITRILSVKEVIDEITEGSRSLADRLHRQT